MTHFVFTDEDVHHLMTLIRRLELPIEDSQELDDWRQRLDNIVTGSVVVEQHDDDGVYVTV
jgi:hypothetical protein